VDADPRARWMTKRYPESALELIWIPSRGVLFGPQFSKEPLNSHKIVDYKEGCLTWEGEVCKSSPSDNIL